MPKKDVVIYHSAQGNTENVAKEIALKLGCDLYKINEENVKNQNSLKLTGKIIRQVLQRNQFKNAIEKIDLSSYERIYVGSPCWFYTYTPPVGQFLKTADYHDKEVVLFLTHKGGPGKTVENFEDAMIGGTFVGSMEFSNVNDTEETVIKTQVKTQLKTLNP